jgi:hypothetical protein
MIKLGKEILEMLITIQFDNYYLPVWFPEFWGSEYTKQ